MESGWNVWVWLVGVVSRRWVWLVGVGGIYGCGEQEVSVSSGCGCKEVYRILIPTPLVSVLFCSSIPTFCSFKKNFFVLVPVLFCVIKFYVLNNFFSQYKHTYGQLRASHGSHMKAAHNVLYMKHTQTFASYPAKDISCMTSRSVV